MADKEPLAVLKQGTNAWNEWRALNPDARVDLSNADLFAANLTEAELTDANLSSVNLTGANLSSVNLTGANLSNADLSNANLYSAKLSNATLFKATMLLTNLSRANMTDAKLTRADLSNADLTGANLTRANLTRANLFEATMFQANLTDANLTDARVNLANLTRANLTRANLTGARLFYTVLGSVDLSKALGLETVVHDGPSVMDHRTLLQSGKLPLSFLRGCGLTDRQIDYLPSLLEAGPIQFYSCFISYSTANQDFADRLYADLQARGVRCWFAPHHMQPGQKLEEQIDRAIRVYDRLLLILSKESMSSAWVKAEIAKAREKEVTSKRHVLFPIALVPFTDIRAWKQFNADLGEDTAREVREYFLPDFSEWKTNHDGYQRSFEKVISALKSADVAMSGT